MKLRDLSTTVLRATLLTLSKLDALPKQREAIQSELALRAWAEAVEERLHLCIRWNRGGLS